MIKAEWTNADNLSQNSSSDELIEEAIPISYIKEIIRIWRSFGVGYYEVTIRDFEWLIEKWEYDRDLEQLKSELKKIEEDAFK